MTGVMVLREDLMWSCPHDHILVENNGAFYTCQKCGVSLKYIPDGRPDIWDAVTKREFIKWLGPNFEKKKVVDWERTQERFPDVECLTPLNLVRTGLGLARRLLYALVPCVLLWVLVVLGLDAFFNWNGAVSMFGLFSLSTVALAVLYVYVGVAIVRAELRAKAKWSTALWKAAGWPATIWNTIDKLYLTTPPPSGR